MCMAADDGCWLGLLCSLQCGGSSCRKLVRVSLKHGNQGEREKDGATGLLRSSLYSPVALLLHSVG